MKHILIWLLALAIGLSSTIPVIPGWITQRKRLTTIAMSPRNSAPSTTSKPHKISTPSESHLPSLTTEHLKEIRLANFETSIAMPLRNSTPTAALQSPKMSTPSESPLPYFTTEGFKEKQLTKSETTSSFCINFYPDHPDAGRETDNKATSEKQQSLESNKTISWFSNGNKYFFCTYFYPDHPDPGRKRIKGNHTTTSTKNSQTSIGNIIQKTLNLPICEDSSIFCTYLYVGKSDPAGRQKKSNYTPIITTTDEIIKSPLNKIRWSSSSTSTTSTGISR